MEQPSVELKNVTKIYRQGESEVYALNDVTLSVADGAFVSLVGPSGSGKSTLLNVLSGLDRVSSGEIYLAGKRIDELSGAELADIRLSQIGFVFQAYNLIPVLTARENVEFVMQLQGISSAERREASTQILKEVGLEGLGERKPAELSGGQQQRVAVARAIVSTPKLVLADEPTANLDSKTAREILEIMQEMNENHGVTFIFSTHDKLVMDYAERIIRLHDGKVLEDIHKDSA